MSARHHHHHHRGGGGGGGGEPGEFSGDDDDADDYDDKREEEERFQKRRQLDQRNHHHHHREQHRRGERYHHEHHHHHRHHRRYDEDEEDAFNNNNNNNNNNNERSSSPQRGRRYREYANDREEREHRYYDRGGGGGDGRGRERDRDRDRDRGRRRRGRSWSNENDDDDDNNNNRSRPKFGVPEELERYREAERRSFDQDYQQGRGGGRQHGRENERTAQNRLNMAQQWLQSNGYEETQKQNEILRKRREVYVGNLIQGVVTPNILADVFNAMLKKIAPKLCEREMAGDPVMNVIMDSQGQFGFVELRCFEMAQIALRFDKVDVCGRPMNVGRPKGYIEDPRVGDDCPQDVVDTMVEFGGSLDDEVKAKERELAKAKAAAAAAAAAKIAAKMKTSGDSSGTATTRTRATKTTEEEKKSSAIKSVNMRLENLISLDEVEAAEKKDQDGAEQLLEQLLHTCLEECEQTIGMVMALAVPTPTQDVFNNPELRKGGARCYVKFDSEAVAEKGVSKMNGREFDESIVKASLVTDEEFDKASENIWV